MDKVVDHLLVFHGDGDIQDFPGNYSQYREWEHLESKTADVKAPVSSDDNKTASQNTKKADDRRSNRARKMTFKERSEFNALTEEIKKLESEKAELEQALCETENLSVEDITEKSRRLPEVTALLDDKEMRWLELSEIEEQS